MDGLTLSKQSVFRSMAEAKKVIMESAERVFKDDDETKKSILVALEGYEKCLTTLLKLGDIK